MNYKRSISQDIIGIPEQNGYFIGYAVDGYLDRTSFKLGGFLLQLFGLPTRLGFCDCANLRGFIDNSFLYLEPSDITLNINLNDLASLQKKLDLTSMRNKPISTVQDGFAGFLEDFDIDKKEMIVNELTTKNEIWEVNTNLSVHPNKEYENIQAHHLDRKNEQSNFSFFKKKVILKV